MLMGIKLRQNQVYDQNSYEIVFLKQLASWQMEPGAPITTK